MLRHTLDLPLGKTVDYAVLIRKREDSPRTASTGETLSEKRGPTIWFSRRKDCPSAADSCAAWTV